LILISSKLILVKLFLDIMRQNGMMTGMNGCRTMKADEDAATATEDSLRFREGKRPSQEVSVARVLGVVLVVALVAALFAGATLFSGERQMSRGASVQGLMPEVVVTGEMPRLTMPTVEVHGYRTVAMSGSDLRVN